MELHIEFLANSSWQAFITESAATAAAVLSDPEFLKRIEAWPRFDFTDKSPAEVASILRSTPSLSIRVGFYHRLLGPSIAKEVEGAVLFNTAKRARGAGSPGNLAHEVMHVLGFSHEGNQPGGNENTVPYRIGQWVDEALTGSAAHQRE